MESVKLKLCNHLFQLTHQFKLKVSQTEIKLFSIQPGFKNAMMTLWNKWRFCDWMNMVFFWHFTFSNKSRFKLPHSCICGSLNQVTAVKTKFKAIARALTESSTPRTCGQLWLSLDVTVDTSVAPKLNYQMQLIELSGIKTCSQFSFLSCVVCHVAVHSCALFGILRFGNGLHKRGHASAFKRDWN